jgi:pimeloyl-ACP methyl ester carboxylesterase
MSISALKQCTCLFLLIIVVQGVYGNEHYITKEIEYETEDGWTISGTLRLPPGAGRNNEYPGMLLLHEKEHDRNEFVGIGDDPGLAQRLPPLGIATLNIDMRGRGLSMGSDQPVDYERHDFAAMTDENTYLDIKAGMQFLADYPGVDDFRLGVVALQYSAEHAIRAIQEIDIPTRAMVILGGTDISQESKDFLASSNMPVFTGASIVDKQILKEMVDIYVNSSHPSSYLVTPYAAERGYNILFFELLDNEAAPGQSRMDFLLNWLGTNVKGLGRNRAITVTTRDGFTIHGNFRYPDDLGKNGKLIPGLVIAPGGRSNRYSYYRFEEDLVKRGIAVVSVEQRGRGQSMMGLTVEDPEIAALWAEDPTESPYYLDVIAGIDYLVSQQGIDPNNIALMGGARGSRNAVLAAAQDPDRIKAMVLMSVYYDEDLARVFPNLETSILMIATEHRASGRTLQAHRAAKNSDLMIYPGDGQTHHIRYFQPGIVDFVGDFLGRELFTESPYIGSAE